MVTVSRWRCCWRKDESWGVVKKCSSSSF